MVAIQASTERFMDIDKAINAINDWRVRFHVLLASAPDPAIAECGPQCAAGQWLRGEAARKYAGLPALEACLAAHDALHLEAAEAIGAVTETRLTPAGACGVGSAFNSAANRAVLSLHSFKQELAALAR